MTIHHPRFKVVENFDYEQEIPLQITYAVIGNNSQVPYPHVTNDISKYGLLFKCIEEFQQALLDINEVHIHKNHIRFCVTPILHSKIKFYYIEIACEDIRKIQIWKDLGTNGYWIYLHMWYNNLRCCCALSIEKDLLNSISSHFSQVPAMKEWLLREVL